MEGGSLADTQPPLPVFLHMESNKGPRSGQNWRSKTGMSGRNLSTSEIFPIGLEDSYGETYVMGKSFNIAEDIVDTEELLSLKDIAV